MQENKRGNLKEYFNENSGVFTGLAVFLAIALLFSNSPATHFLAFTGFFLSFILICYLFKDMEKIKISNGWFFGLYF